MVDMKFSALRVQNRILHLLPSEIFSDRSVPRFSYLFRTIDSSRIEIESRLSGNPKFYDKKFSNSQERKSVDARTCIAPINALNRQPIPSKIHLSSINFQNSTKKPYFPMTVSLRNNFSQVCGLYCSSL